MRYPIIPYDRRLKERARQLRKNMTPGERKLWQHLKGKQMMGYDARPPTSHRSIYC